MAESLCRGGGGGGVDGTRLGAHARQNCALSVRRPPISACPPHLPSSLERAGKQVRERYINQLNPRIKHAPFTPEEDAHIFHMHTMLGSRWAEISKTLEGRCVCAAGGGGGVGWEGGGKEEDHVVNTRRLASRRSSTHSTPFIPSPPPFPPLSPFPVAPRTPPKTGGTRRRAKRTPRRARASLWSRPRTTRCPCSSRGVTRERCLTARPSLRRRRA